MAWTDKMVEDLRKMWKDGLTTGEIGKRLGVSKNSIIGKVHRLGLSGRPSPIKKKSDTPQAPKPATSSTPSKKTEPVSEKKVVSSTPKKNEDVPSVAKEDKIEAEKKFQAPLKEPLSDEPLFKADLKKNSESNGKTSLVDLDHHTCRWPIGDPKDENFHFCGKKVKIGQTYCDEHAAIAYVKPNKKITFV